MLVLVPRASWPLGLLSKAKASRKKEMWFNTALLQLCVVLLVSRYSSSSEDLGEFAEAVSSLKFFWKAFSSPRAFEWLRLQ